MISKACLLVSGTVLAAGLNPAAYAAGPDTAASYYVYNTSVAGLPYTNCPGGRGGPVPQRNPGCSLNNPPCAGVDDPWRPPHVWPQTRYPMVPAYVRPNYGYYETSWRTLNVCGGPVARLSPLQRPASAVPYPTPLPAPAVTPAPAATPAKPAQIPRPPQVAPAPGPRSEPAPSAPKSTLSPNTPAPDGFQDDAPHPPKAVAPAPQRMPRRPKELAPKTEGPAPVPSLDRQGAETGEPVERAAFLEPVRVDGSEFAVRPF